MIITSAVLYLFEPMVLSEGDLDSPELLGDKDRVAVDPAGNAIPLRPGEKVEGSPDGQAWQVKDENGNPTGDRYDGKGHPKQSDPKAQKPHGHRVDRNGRPLLDETGNPHLPAYPPKK